MDVLVRCWKNVEAGKHDVQFVVYDAPSKEAVISMVREQYPPVFQHIEAGEIVDGVVEEQSALKKKSSKKNRKI